jgi:hypothetical protein
MRNMFKVFLVLGLAGVLTGPAWAQGRGFGMFGGGGPAGLVSNKSVQKELGLTEDQAKKATEAVNAVRQKHQDDFAGLRDLEGEERAQKAQQLMKTVGDEQMKSIADILSADQIKRLKQISLQTRGAQAFADPEIQKDLKLTDDQKDKIKTINDDARQEMGALFSGGGGFGDPETQKKMAALRKETLEKVTAVLEDSQKKSWKEMTGNPFEVKFEPGQFGKGKFKKKDSQ